MMGVGSLGVEEARNFAVGVVRSSVAPAGRLHRAVALGPERRTC